MRDTFRDLMRFGRAKYREVFKGEAGAYVLSDLRNWAKAKPEQLEPEALYEEFLTSERQFIQHMERVRFYQRIRKFLELRDEEIDRAERRIAEIQTRGEIE